MKKLLALTLILSLACLNIIGCGGGEKKESAPAIEQEAKGTTIPAPREETATVALTWEQIPVYPGASLEKESTITDHPQYELFENRLYKTQEAPKKGRLFLQGSDAQERLERFWALRNGRGL